VRRLGQVQVMFRSMIPGYTVHSVDSSQKQTLTAQVQVGIASCTAP
jgi:hypothetical protein